MFGKVASDLQNGITVGTDSISGHLNYIEDYSSAFSGDLASGNYIALHAETDVEGTTIVVTVTEPSTLDSDGNVVLRIADKDTQTVTVTASKEDYNTATKVYTLSELTVDTDSVG